MSVPPGQQVKLHSRYLQIEQRGDGLLFSFDRCLVENDVLRFREGEVRRVVRARLKRLGALSQGSVGRQFCVLGDADDKAVCGIVSKLDMRLDLIASRPFTPKVVESLLGISKQERLRWSKDGRLPRSGSATFRKGTPITIATHPADKTLELAADPSVIAEWRRADSSSAELEG